MNYKTCFSTYALKCNETINIPLRLYTITDISFTIMCGNLFYIDDNEFDHLIVGSLVKAYTDCKKMTSFLNGREALELLSKNRLNADELPDVILVDLFMPAFSGWDFLDGLSKIYLALSKKIRVFILSSSIKREDIEQSKNYSFVQSYITKPLTQRLLENLDIAN